MTGSTETEIKLAVEDLPTIQSRLHSLSFTVLHPRVFEANTVYDTKAQDLRQNSSLLRLRQVGERTVLTWKGPPVAGPHKQRPEEETTVGSFDKMALIFEKLGYLPTFRYEKYRTEFSKPGSLGVVVLDETPIGNFLEIEGEAAWIDATARDLGFLPEDYLLESYGSLYLQYCRQAGVEPGHMVFSSHS
jgi:adenylate cyclase, class 2